MVRPFAIAMMFTVAAGWGLALADDSASKSAKLGEQSWQVTDVILKHHVNPPARQEMLLAGAKNLLKQAGVAAPADLSRCVSDVVSLDQWRALLSEFLGKQNDGSVQATKLEGALVAGLLQAVPGHPHVVAAEDRKAIEGFAANRYVGTGVQIRYTDEKLAQLVSPIRNGPAHRAGAKPGDLILEIDGKPTHDIGLRAVVDLLRGDEGADVTVVVRQPKSEEKRTLRITRGVSPVETVLGFHRIEKEDRWHFRPEPGAAVGYVALQMLTSSTLHELKAMEPQLKEQGIRALVLDLRFAQSNSAHHAALVADALLDGGMMWKMKDAKQNVREVKADRDCLFRDWPLFVLVDQTTGGPAAWITGALQDNGRAIVVGQTAVRDGYTKSFVDLPGGKNAVELATGLVERGTRKKSKHADPEDELDSNSSQGWVIQPDHVVTMSPAQRDVIHQWLLHMSWTEPPAGSEKAPSDPQLTKAIELARKKLSDDPDTKNVEPKEKP